MSINPNQLTITEMWTLYGLLKNGVVEDEKEYLIDSVSNMLDKLSQHEFVSSMLLLYKNVNLKEVNPVTLVTMFIAGLKKNNFFDFVDFVKELNGSTKR